MPFMYDHIVLGWVNIAKLDKEKYQCRTLSI